MNMVKLIFSILLFSCLTTGATASTASFPSSMRTADVTDQIIIKLEPAIPPRSPAASQLLVENIIATTGGLLTITASYGRPMADDAHVIHLSAPISLQDATNYSTLLAANPNVDYAEPDQWMSPSTDVTPNDTGFTYQWNLQSPNSNAGAANLTAAWGETTGSSSVTVAVVDTGVVNHTDLAPRLVGGNASLSGRDFVSSSAIGNDGDGQDNNPSDPGDWVSSSDASNPVFANCSVHNSSWHGTHVAGTIGAITNNSQGVAGVDWNARLLIARSMGKCGGYLSDVADAIRWSAGETVNGASNPNPARIINLSLGSSGACGQTYQDAINIANAHGAAVVVAAGNSNADISNHRPANCQNVITVAALEKNGGKASFSNSGGLVDIAAPGVSILSTFDSGKTSPAGDSYAYYNGTSMATPQVSGVLALMLAANTHLTDGSISATTVPALLKTKLKASARAFASGTGSDCSTNTCGAGALDAYRAVMSVKTPPVANAGANQTVQPGASVTLHGSGSDASPAGQIVSYLWEQTAGTSVSLNDRNSATPLFAAPAGAGVLTFRLTVSNTVGLTSTSYTNITVEAAAPSCSEVLASNGNATGQWTSNCASHHRTDRYARYYTFTLDRPATITANLTSASQDTYLFLLQGGGMDGSVLTYNDDSNGSTNSQIVRSLEAGTYTLEATTYYTKREGSFNIQLSAAVETTNQTSCSTTAISVGQQLTGQWDSNCISTHRGSTYYAGYYTFTLSAPTDVSIHLDSTQQDTYLYLLEGNNSQGQVITFNDDSNGTTNSSIERSLPAGTYTLEATTYAAARTGSFTISLTTPSGGGGNVGGDNVGGDNVGGDSTGSGCAPAALFLGQSVDGIWSSDCTSTHRGENFYAAYYTFTLNAQAAMTIDLQSSEQDTYLYLLRGNDANGAVLSFNDDSHGVTNSQITRTLPAGTYTLEATTYRAARTGAFTIRAQAN